METPETTPYTHRVELKVPCHELFLCFKDEKAMICGRINWRQETIIDSIDFLMVNLHASSNLKLGFVAECGTGLGMALVKDDSRETYSTYHLPNNIIGGTDLSRGNRLEFVFGVFLNNANPTKEDLCIACSTKPRSKDGMIIIGI